MWKLRLQRISPEISINDSKKDLCTLKREQTEKEKMTEKGDYSLPTKFKLYTFS